MTRVYLGSAASSPWTVPTGFQHSAETLVADTSGQASAFYFNWGDASTRARFGTTFKATSTASVTGIAVRMTQVGTGAPTDSCTLKLYNGSSFTGNTLLQTSASIVGNTLPNLGLGEYVWFEFPQPVTLTSGVTYSWALERSGAVNASIFFRCLGDQVSFYADGQPSYYDGTNWSSSGLGTWDISFKVGLRPHTIGLMGGGAPGAAGTNGTSGNGGGGGGGGAWSRHTYLSGTYGATVPFLVPSTVAQYTQWQSSTFNTGSYQRAGGGTAGSGTTGGAAGSAVSTVGTPTVTTTLNTSNNGGAGGGSGLTRGGGGGGGAASNFGAGSPGGSPSASGAGGGGGGGAGTVTGTGASPSTATFGAGGTGSSGAGGATNGANGTGNSGGAGSSTAGGTPTAAGRGGGNDASFDFWSTGNGGGGGGCGGSTTNVASAIVGGNTQAYGGGGGGCGYARGTGTYTTGSGITGLIILDYNLTLPRTLVADPATFTLTRNPADPAKTGKLLDLSTAVAPVGMFKNTICNQWLPPIPVSEQGNSWGGGAGQYERVGVVFTASRMNFEDYGITDVSFILNNGFGTFTDNMWVELFAVNASNLPTGSALATSSVIATSTLTPGDAWYKFDFPTPYTVRPGVKYAAVLTRTTQDPSNPITLHVATTNTTGAINLVAYTSGSWAMDPSFYPMFSVGCDAENYWIVGRDVTTGTTLDCLKSVDPINYGWFKNNNVSGWATAISGISAYQTGNLLNIVVADGAAPNVGYYLCVFDMSIGDFNAILGEPIATGLTTAGGTGSTQYGSSIVQRDSTGAYEIVVAFNGAAVSSRARIYAARRTAVGTWGTGIVDQAAASTDYIKPEVVIGEQGYAHFFYQNVTAGVANERSLSFANTFSTAITTSTLAAAGQAVSYKPAATRYVVDVNSGAGKAHWRFTDAGSGPVSPAAATTSPGGTPVDPHRLFVDVNGAVDTLYSLHLNNTDGDIYVISSTDHGATWSAATQIFAGAGAVPNSETSLSRDSTLYQHGNNFVLPYVVNDAGSLYAKEYTVRSALASADGLAQGTSTANAVSVAGTVPPVFRSLASTTYASRTNTVVTAPAGIVNDDILLAFVAAGKTASASPAITPPAGFTELSNSPTTVVDGSTFQVKFHVYWKRAASESGSYTFTHVVATTQAVILAFSGANTSGNPIDIAAPNSANTGTTATNPGVTTTVANDLLIYAMHDWDAIAKAPPSTFTEIFDLGSGGVIEIATKNLGAAGATGSTTTPVNSLSNPWATYTIGLEAATAAVTSSGQGLAAGTSTVLALSQSIGLAAGTSTVLARSQSIGLAAGTSTVLALSQSRGLATGTSTVLAQAAGRGLAQGTSTVLGDGSSAAVMQGTNATGTSTVLGRAAVEGDAAGVGTALGRAAGQGAASGTSTAAALSQSRGLATGTSTVAAAGTGIFTATSSLAAGTSTADAIATAVYVITGNADGTSTVNAVNSGITLSGDGLAAGASTVAAVGTGILTSTGNAAGTSTALAQEAGRGFAVGTSTVLGTGAALAISGGISLGTSQVAAQTASTGSAAGTSTPAGRAALQGTAQGTSTVSAFGVALNVAKGDAAGTSTALASSLTIGLAQGTSTVNAASLVAALSRGDAAGTTTVAAFTGAAGAGLAQGTSTVNATGTWTITSQGNAAGTSTVTGQAAAKGAVTSNSTVLATGAALFAGAGNAAGTSTVLGRAAPQGLAQGTSTVNAASLVAAVSAGLAQGTSNVSAISGSALRGDANGTSAVNAVATAITNIVGNAAGTTTVANATGASAFAGKGTAAGTTTVANAVGASAALSAGLAQGTSTISGISGALAAGLAQGTSTVNATSTIKLTYPGSAAGTSTADANVRAIAAGAAAGTSAVTASGTAIKISAGTNATGTSTVLANGSAIKTGDGLAQGTSTANAVMNFAATGVAAGVGSGNAVSTIKIAAVGNAAGTTTITGIRTVKIAVRGDAAGQGAANGNALAYYGDTEILVVPVENRRMELEAEDRHMIVPREDDERAMEVLEDDTAMYVSPRMRSVA